MAAATPTTADVQALLKRIAAARERLAAGGDADRARLAAIEPELRGLWAELRLPESGALDPATWDALPEPARAALAQRLDADVRILEARATPADGAPTDPASIMFGGHAPNWAVWGLTIVSAITALLVLALIHDRWQEATVGAACAAPLTAPAEGEAGAPDDSPTPTPADTPAPPEGGAGGANGGRKAAAGAKACGAPTEQDVLFMIVLMGALGGSLHWMSSMAKFVGNGTLRTRWIPYYVLMPIEGAALAPMIYLLLRTGVLQNGAAVKHLNFVSLYAFAGLTGLFTQQATAMLADVFSIVFKRVRGGDPLPSPDGQQGAAGNSQPPAGGQS